MIELCIKDNGKEFDVDYTLSTKNPKHGLGLISMQERTEMLGGSFGITSDKEKGTIVRAILPC